MKQVTLICTSLSILSRRDSGRRSRFGSSGRQPVDAGAGIADGLQLHIEFEGDVVDGSANGFDGQASGGLQYVPGMLGQAASFDNDFTLAFWFNIPLDQGYSVLGKREICARDPFIDIRTGNISPNVSLEVSDAAQNYFPGAVQKPAGWHHVAFTRTGTSYQSFFNGQLRKTGETTVSLDITNDAIPGLSNSPCVVLDGTDRLKALIDDLRLYNRVLSTEEVAALAGPMFADGSSGDATRVQSRAQYFV